MVLRFGNRGTDLAHASFAAECFRHGTLTYFLGIGPQTASVALMICKVQGWALGSGSFCLAWGFRPRDCPVHIPPVAELS